LNCWKKHNKRSDVFQIISENIRVGDFYKVIEHIAVIIDRFATIP